MPDGASLGEAVLHLLGDSSKLIATTKGAKTEVDGILGKVGNGLNAASKGIIGTGTAIAAIGGAVYGMASKVGATADDLLVGAQKAGVTVEEYQKLKYASELVDVSTETMTASMNKFTSVIGDAAAGDEDLLAKFDAMGVSLYDQEGQLRSVYDIWLDTIDGLGGVENATEQNILAQDLFGRSFGELKPLIQSGSGALKAYGDEAEAAGIVLSESQVAALAKVDDAIQQTKAQISGIFLSMIAENAPQMTQFITGAGNLLKSLVPLAVSVINVLTSVMSWLANMPTGAQQTILAIAGIILVAAKVVPVISSVIGVVQTLSAFLAGPAAASIAAVVAPILPIIAIIAAVIAVIALLYAAWKNNWFGIRDTTQAVIGGIVNFWNGTFLPAIRSVASWVGDKLGGAFDRVRNAISGVWDWIKKLAGSLANIKLPSWMTPGSPTPWEIGLRGVSSAMGRLDTESLPGLSNALGSLNAQIATGVPAQVNTQTSSTQQSISFQVNNPVGETTDESMSRGMRKLQFLGVV